MLAPLGQIGVGLFVMISAYFLSNEGQQPLKKTFRRIWNIWLRVLFYSWLILILDVIFKFNELNHHKVLKSIFPIIFNNYWFVTSFIFLMMLVPLLNYLIDRSSRRQLLGIMIIMIIFSGIIPIVGEPFTPLGHS